MTLEIDDSEFRSGAVQVERDAFHELFFELETSVETAHFEGRCVTGADITKMIVDAIAEKLV
jgi:hypothetical protein